MRALLYYLLSFSVANAEIHLMLNTEHINVQIGDKPDLQCYTEESASFLIMNPLTWQKIDRDGSKLKISTFANVETRFEQEYDIEIDTNATGLIFTLQFLQGIKEEHDGFFSCAIHSQNDQVLAEKSVEVSVILAITNPITNNPFSSTESSIVSEGQNLCDYTGIIQCLPNADPNLLSLFIIPSFNDSAKIDQICRSLEDIYICTKTKLESCSRGARLKRDVMFSGARFICNTDRRAFLDNVGCLQKLTTANTFLQCLNGIRAELGNYFIGVKDVFSETKEFCRLATNWTTCFVETAKSICDHQGHTYMYNYVMQNYAPVNDTLHCDLLSDTVPTGSHCLSYPCFNGGTCIQNPDAYECLCPNKIFGSRCELGVGGCPGYPCYNGGSCFADESGQRCECPQDFPGLHCEGTIKDITTGSPSEVTASETTPEITTSTPSLCEEVKADVCRQFGITKTTFPNFFSGYTQEEALRVFNNPIFKRNMNCSDNAILFYCSSLFPKCDNGKREFPCKELCLAVYNECGTVSILNDVDDCRYYPNEDCISPLPSMKQPLTTPSYTHTFSNTIIDSTTGSPSDVTTPAETTPEIPKSTPRRCEEVQADVCRQFGITKTTFPNFFSQYTQEAALDTFNNYIIKENMSCSDNATLFYCSSFFPKCENGKIELPCKELCLAVYNECGPLAGLGDDCNYYPNEDCISSLPPWIQSSTTPSNTITYSRQQTQQPAVCNTAIDECISNVGESWVQDLLKGRLSVITSLNIDHVCSVLDQIYFCTDSKLQDCSDGLKLVLSTVVTSARYICNTGKQGFTHNRHCFTYPTILSDLQQCTLNLIQDFPNVQNVSLVESRDEICGLFRTWRSCMIEPIKKECNQYALIYMQSFIDESLRSVIDNLHCNAGFISNPTISSPVTQSITQVPGKCDFMGALQCSKTVGTESIQRFVTASFTNITDVESFCGSLERVYLCIGTKLDYCSKDIRLLRDVVLSGSRYLCNTDRNALLNSIGCIQRLGMVNVTAHCTNRIAEEFTPYILGEKSVFNHTVEFCRLGTSWTTCFLAKAETVCDQKGYSYMYNYMRQTFIPLNNALNCDLLSENDCQSSPCYFGGTCVQQLDGYCCICPSNLFGRRCGMGNFGCPEYPCFNGGTCVTNDVGSTCLCYHGYTGKHCQDQRTTPSFRTRITTATTPATTESYSSTTVSQFKSCRYIGSFGRHRQRKNIWCTRKCNNGYCPSKLCRCYPLTCHSIGIYENQRGFNEWCTNNCKRGYCPKSFCKCTRQSFA
ncbi:uncharacterized protein LOC127737808 isoform X2 [Mytilus californianus]|uniref:uncharacterized protein LOC127737808 isoform X2 n=1 Tax=Mytilus californianus TaxID=6549 RepID=UPI002247DB6B|nr:uncharacterized protein LOC127737808 isoform X2 [Mytilus californianus]